MTCFDQATVFDGLALAYLGCGLILLLGIVCAGGCNGSATQSGAGGGSPTNAEEPADDLATQLQMAVSSRQFDRALELAPQALIAHPDDPDVLTNVAIAKAQSGSPQEGAKFLVDAAKAAQFDPSGGRVDNAVSILLSLGRLYDAIDLLDQTVKAHPGSVRHRRMLFGFLSEAQLTQEAFKHAGVLIQQGQFDLPLLLATTDTSSRRFSTEAIETMVGRNPGDLRPRLALAQQALDQRDVQSAEEILRAILARHPDFAPGHAMLGDVLVTAGKYDALPQWYQSLPSDTEQWAGYWTALGGWALDRGDVVGSVRAFATATRQTPNVIAMWARLGEAMRLAADVATRDSSGQDHPIEFDKVIAGIDARRANLLRLRDHFAQFKDGGNQSQRLAIAIAKDLISLGRFWEARGWWMVAMNLREDPSTDLIAVRDEINRRLQDEPNLQAVNDHPELAFSVDRFPLPDPSASAASDSRPRRVELGYDPNPIRYEEQASARGLNFYAEIGDGVDGPRVPITQTLGCGGGVIDVDLDGRHDLVFAAAGGTIGERNSQLGAMFRNIGDEFLEITEPSGFGDPGFGHGVVVADFNDDGFDDVLVLNFGKNRLFRNNGDGSFGDATASLNEFESGDWSTSGAVVDLDGDGLNDLVIVNYCDADQPLEAPCFDAAGNEINCYPLRYRASRDRFLKGQPDGTFQDQTDQWTKNQVAGRGLGIVAGCLDGNSQSVYIVNDASPNSLYRWHEDVDGSPLGTLIDQGVASGLAVDAQSLDQGSMGIASADVDNDGDLDFYVTGFANEYNILYLQQSPGFWADRSAAHNLVNDTLNVVGFGSEAIDMDNDGTVELVTTNGHIGDFGNDVIPFAQRLQTMRRSESEQYSLVDMTDWSPYFTAPHVGRCLFSLDVESDGYLDFVVTHATEHVALAVNQSPRDHHRIGFRLVDTKQARNAVGAMIEFSVGSQSEKEKRRLYAVSGFGYLCSNQRELVAGLGTQANVSGVRVIWPDGEVDQYGSLHADREYLLVRGQPPFELSRYPNR